IENRKVVRDIRELMELRNSHKAFGLDGECITESNGSKLIIMRKCGEHSLTLKADLKSYDFIIE
ncbi:sucrose phosphorylase, partial [Clostridium butyricum]|nr:sucrose phosphorylase [Clostridium butyricum]